MEIIKLSDFKRKNFSKAVNELYQLTDFNNSQYPNYMEWFFGKNIPRIIRGEGDVLFTLDGLSVQGLIVMKNTTEEKKLCTFMVDECYRKQIIGTNLLEEAFKYLKTDKPSITIPENNIEQFKFFIDYYDWKNTGITDQYNSREIIYN